MNKPVHKNQLNTKPSYAYKTCNLQIHVLVTEMCNYHKQNTYIQETLSNGSIAIPALLHNVNFGVTYDKHKNRDVRTRMNIDKKSYQVHQTKINYFCGVGQLILS